MHEEIGTIPARVLFCARWGVVALAFVRSVRNRSQTRVRPVGKCAGISRCAISFVRRRAIQRVHVRIYTVHRPGPCGKLSPFPRVYVRVCIMYNVIYSGLRPTRECVRPYLPARAEAFSNSRQTVCFDVCTRLRTFTYAHTETDG